MGVLAQFEILPEGYIQQMNSILAFPGETTEELTRAVNRMRTAWQEVAACAGELYKPKFNL